MHTTGSAHALVTCLAQWSQCIQRAQCAPWLPAWCNGANAHNGLSAHQGDLPGAMEPIVSVGSSARLGYLPATVEPTHAMGSSARQGDLPATEEPTHAMGSSARHGL
jgi:hypothetical protein